MAVKVKALYDAHTCSRDMHTPVQWALTGLSDLSLLLLHFLTCELPGLAIVRFARSL